MVLHEKGAGFEVREVDLKNKSEEFLSASPTGKVPVIVAGGTSIYESNVINQYIDEVLPDPRLLPESPEDRAHARIWMASADDSFFPALLRAARGGEMGLSAEQLSEAQEKLAGVLSSLEKRLEGREYLAGGFSLADIAHAGAFTHLRKLEEENGAVSVEYPNVSAWVQRVEGRGSYRAAG